jgi:hypothetical protein
LADDPELHAAREILRLERQGGGDVGVLALLVVDDQVLVALLTHRGGQTLPGQRAVGQVADAVGDRPADRRAQRHPEPGQAGVEGVEDRALAPDGGHPDGRAQAPGAQSLYDPVGRPAAPQKSPAVPRRRPGRPALMQLGQRVLDPLPGQAQLSGQLARRARAERRQRAEHQVGITRQPPPGQRRDGGADREVRHWTHRSSSGQPTGGPMQLTQSFGP